MVRTVRIGMGLLSCLFFLVCCGCDESGSGVRTEDNGLYTRYNLHYVAQEGVNVGSYANFTDYPGHAFLPYNTKVEVKNWKRGYRITAVDSGIVILFDYKSKNMDGMRGSDYLDLILSPEPVSYTGLSAVDEQGIQQGKAMVGMTKQGVMIALGYPAKHRTPSLDENTWAYWKGRLGDPRLVQFDGSGKVVSITN
jgi:hypothetical protein